MLSETKYFFFLSDILDKKVKKGSGETLGRIIDIVILTSPAKIYPEITALVVTRGLFGQRLKIPITGLEPFELPIKHLYLKSDAVVEEFIEPITDGANGVTLLVRETFLDKQILDTAGCKVVRVNDIHLLKEKNYIWVVHVDIGFRGIVRRLGWLELLDTVMEWVFSYKPNERFVSWKYVSPLPQSGERKTDTLALAPSYQCFTDINPADMADIINDINRDERIAMFKLLDINIASDAIVELNPQVQKELFESLDKTRRAKIIALMPDNKLADLLNHLGRRRADEVIRQLTPEKADKIKGLLLHPEQTAGALMTTQYIALNKDLTVAEAFARFNEMIASSSDLYFYHIYAVDAEQNLLGVIPVRKLLLAVSEEKALQPVIPKGLMAQGKSNAKLAEPQRSPAAYSGAEAVPQPHQLTPLSVEHSGAESPAAGLPDGAVQASVSAAPQKLSDIMTTKIIKVKPLTRQHKIVDLIRKYNFTALPVVDAQNKLKGIVLLKDALSPVANLA
ncbi:MAG: CBS domain-containing protein [Planctomycetota bacterium]